MTTFDPEARDASLAAERTDLSWNRSGLSLLACGLLVMRGLSRPPLETGRVAIGLVIVILGVFTWALGAWNAHQRLTSGGAPARRRDLLPVAVSVAVVGVAAFVVAAFAPS